MEFNKTLGSDHPRTIECDKSFSDLVKHIKRNPAKENAGIIGQNS